MEEHANVQIKVFTDKSKKGEQQKIKIEISAEGDIGSCNQILRNIISFRGRRPVDFDPDLAEMDISK